jgi:hypothetical protein
MIKFNLCQNKSVKFINKFWTVTDRNLFLLYYLYQRQLNAL